MVNARARTQALMFAAVVLLVTVMMMIAPAIAAAVTPDMYEPDDVRPQARAVTPDGAIQHRTIYPSDDQDWLKFEAKTGYVYTVSTSSYGMGAYSGYTPFKFTFSNLVGDVLGEDWYRDQSSILAEENGIHYLAVEQAHTPLDPFAYTLTLTESEASSIEGTVTAEGAGTPLEGVSVYLEASVTEVWGTYYEWVGSAETASDGSYGFEGLAPGDYYVYFDPWTLGGYLYEAWDDRSGYEPADTITLPAGTTFNASAELAAAGAIGGLVTDDSTSDPIPGIDVSVWEYTGVSSYWSMSGYEFTNWARTDSLGQYEVGGLAAGQQRVLFEDTAKAYVDEWHEDADHVTVGDDVQVDSGATTVLDAGLGVDPDSAMIQGRVTDRLTGEPIADVFVGIGGASSYPFSGYNFKPMTFSGYPLPGFGFSTYTLMDSPAPWIPKQPVGYATYTMPDGTYRMGGIKVRPEGYVVGFSDYYGAYVPEFHDDVVSLDAATQVHLMSGASVAVPAELDRDSEAAFVRGTVTDDLTGDPIEGVDVLMTPLSGYFQSSYNSSGYWDPFGFSGYNFWHTWTSSDGTFQMRGMRPSDEITYTLQYMPWGDTHASEAWNDQPYYDPTAFKLVTGENVFDAALERPSNVSGTVTDASSLDPIGGIEVELWDRTFSGYRHLTSSWTKSDGSYEFMGLNPHNEYYTYYSSGMSGYGGYVSEWFADASEFASATPLPLVSDDVTTIDVALDRAPDVPYASGQVTDDYFGLPVENVRVDVYENQGVSGYHLTGLWALTDASGSFEVLGVLPDRDYAIGYSDPFDRYISEFYDDELAIEDSFMWSPVAGDSLFTSVQLTPMAMDTVPPNVYDDAVATYYNSADVTIWAEDAYTGVDALFWNLDSAGWETSATTTYTVSVSGEGAHTLEYYATDIAGTASDTETAVFQIIDDAQPPTTTVNPPVPAGWQTSKPVTVTLEATDTVSSVDTTKYWIDSGAPMDYTVPVEVDDEGETTLRYMSIDKAGNREATQSVTVQIDTVAPSTTSDARGVYYDSAKITLSPSDATPGSGLDTTYYSLNGAAAVAGTSVNITSLGTYTLDFWSVDLAGNVEATTRVTFDVEAASTERVSDNDRFTTAVQIAREGWADGGSDWSGVKHVVIASGEDRAAADPLAAAGLCGVYDAPLFLVSADRVPTQVKAAIKEIAADNPGSKIAVHIVGGPVSVPDARYNEIASYVGASRLSKDRLLSTGGRFEMAAEIAREVKRVGGTTPKTVLIANGADATKFFDALALSPIAANNGYPILLVSKDAVPSATKSVMSEFSPTTVIVGGGPATVSDTVKRQLGATRWSGRDRYFTATTIADNAIAANYLDAVHVGVAAKLPDALTGGSMVGVKGGPLVITDGTRLTPVTGSWLSAHKATIGKCYIYGGEKSVTPAVRSQIEARLK